MLTITSIRRASGPTDETGEAASAALKVYSLIQDQPPEERERVALGCIEAAISYLADYQASQTLIVESVTFAQLLDAVGQVLDDMGADGTSCCLAAKAQLRVAYEPFRDPELLMDMPLNEACEIIRRVAEP